MRTISNPVDALEKDGFVVLPSILNSKQVEEAYQEFINLFEQDLEDRRAREITEAHNPDGPLGYTILTQPSHLALNVYTKSSVFDSLLEIVLSHPTVNQLIAAWSGPHYRIFSVNLRYMTGNYDPPPSHELHRDATSSINLGIMLTDVPVGDNGATALVKGSHWAKIEPRWESLLQAPYRLSKKPTHNGVHCLVRWNFFNRLLRKRWFPKITGAFGNQGDVYLFPNGELWHGRLPNLHGKKAMICLIGLQGTDAETRAAPLTIPPEVINKLFPKLKKALVGPFVENDSMGTLWDQIQTKRQKASFFSIEYWAKQERKWAEWFSEIILRMKEK